MQVNHDVTRGLLVANFVVNGESPGGSTILESGTFALPFLETGTTDSKTSHDGPLLITGPPLLRRADAHRVASH